MSKMKQLITAVFFLFLKLSIQEKLTHSSSSTAALSAAGAKANTNIASVAEVAAAAVAAVPASNFGAGFGASRQTTTKSPAKSSQAKSATGGKQSVADVPPIIIEGNKFFYSNNGSQFFMRGIAYQQTLDPALLETQRKEFEKEQLEGASAGTAKTEATLLTEISEPDLGASKFLDIKYIDPLADEKSCLRDVPYLIDLNVNLIRVYSVDPLAKHDVCMNALAEAGIYVISDLSEPYTSINRKSPTWDTDSFDRYKAVVDSLAKYNNVLGFFAGNEVTNDNTNTDASPFVKAAIRDVKKYIAQKNYRKIPVGYSTNDDAETRMNLANYFICDGEDEQDDVGSAAADFYGINMYEWCGYSSFFSSGYSERTVEFQNYTIPVFFSEFGCNLVRPRPFQEVEALFSPLMTNVWSGGIVYMYFEETNNYGLVKVDHEKNLVKKLDDFRFLRDAYRSVNPKLSTAKNLPKSESGAVSIAGSLFPSSKKNVKVAASALPTKLKEPLTCPAVQPGVWEAHSKLPPTPLNFKCECLESSLECIVSPKKKKHDFSKLYGILCHEVGCEDISSNGTTGEYVFYSDCDDKQRLSYILNKYYLKNGKEPSSCDFDGEAFLNTQACSQQDLDNISKNGVTCSSVLKETAVPKNEASKKKGQSPLSGNNGGSSGRKKTSSAVKLSLSWLNFAIASFMFTFF